jgi:Protein of unknown function (DUF3570)
VQLKRPASKRRGLTAATLGLLGAAAAPAPAQAQLDVELPSEQPGKQWEFDTGLLLYSEADGRVQAVEPVVNARYNLGDERVLSTRFVIDTLTGASPNGATPASTPQTFSSPSGRGSFTADPNERPLDDSFKDTRFALSGDYLFPVGEDGKLSYGASASKEYDFLSAGANARYAHDFNQGNTTLSAGASFEADQLNPVGGVPVGLTQPENKDGDKESKSVLDVVVGLTQVLDPQSLVQVNYSLSTSSGYHTDPYKILSVVDASGEPLRYVYELRPDSRTKHAAFLRYKRFVLARDVFDVSYRFMTDDWQVDSSTLDTTWRWNYSETSYLEPHLRWYTQSAADFYHVALDDGEETTVDFASADPRLGAFDGTTVGLKYGHTFASGSSWNARLEYYQQSGKRDGVPPQAAAGLSKFDYEPDLSAVMFTVGYRFKW